MVIKNITLDFREVGGDSEPKIVGVRDGAGQVIFDEFFFNNHPHYKTIFFHDVLNDRDRWKKWVKWKSYGSNLSKIKLDKAAKHTDYMNAIGLFRGMFVSNRFKEILETANLPNHHFFELTFVQDEKVIDGYWWFCFDYETGENTVDFSKCEYNLRDHKRIFGENFSIDIQSYQDYLHVFYTTGRAIQVTELVFNSNFDSELDIFGTQFLTNQVYISAKLHKKLQEENITGYRAGYPIFELGYIM